MARKMCIRDSHRDGHQHQHGAGRQHQFQRPHGALGPLERHQIQKMQLPGRRRHTQIGLPLMLQRPIALRLPLQLPRFYGGGIIEKRGARLVLQDQLAVKIVLGGRPVQQEAQVDHAGQIDRAVAHHPHPIGAPAHLPGEPVLRIQRRCV